MAKSNSINSSIQVMTFNEALNLALDAHKRNKFTLAISILSQILKSSPHYPEIWLRLFSWQNTIGDIGASYQTIQTAYEKCPTDRRIIENYIGSRCVQQEFNDAYAILQNFLNRDDQWVLGWLILARIGDSLKDNELARNAHLQAFKIIQEQLKSLSLSEIISYADYLLVIARIAYSYKDNEEQAIIEQWWDRLKEEENKYGQDTQSTAEFYLFKSKIYQHFKQLEEARDLLLYAAEIHPADRDIYLELAEIYRPLNRLDKTMEMTEKALACDTDNEQIKFNLSYLKISFEEFKEGFELYTYRRKDLKVYQHGQIPACPEWDGTIPSDQALDKLKLLIWGEQGLGDVIRFTGLVKRLIDRGVEVKLGVDLRLEPLYRQSFGDSVFALTDSDVLKSHALEWRSGEGEADAHCLFGDLARFHDYKGGFFDPPAQTWLKSNPKRLQEIKAKLSQIGPARLNSDQLGFEYKIVVISWASIGLSRESRNLDLKGFIEKFKNENIMFISGQYGDFDHDIQMIKDELGVEIYKIPDLDLKNDLEGVVALLDIADFVISIGNLLAHLACSLGKECYVLIPHHPIPFWLHNRNDSPWYPSARLFRKEFDQDWKEPIQQLYSYLKPQILSIYHNYYTSMKHDPEKWWQQFIIHQPYMPQNSTTVILESNLARVRGHNSHAFKTLRKLFTLHANTPNPFMHLIDILSDIGRHRWALQLCEKAIIQLPYSTSICEFAAIKFNEAFQPQKAIQILMPFVMSGYISGKAYNSLGVSFRYLGQGQEAHKWFEKSYQEDQNNNRYAINMILSNLLLGQYNQAWTFYRQYRQPWHQYTKFPLLKDDVWDGRPLKGEKILIYPDQGLGDNLMLIRFMKQLKEFGAIILYQCYEALFPLIDYNIKKGNLPIDHLLPMAAFTEKYDYVATMMDIPAFLDISEQDIEIKINEGENEKRCAHYLEADPVKIKLWKSWITQVEDEINSDERSLKVGINWAGKASYGADNQRSLQLSQLSDLFNIPNIKWYSIQMHDSRNQLNDLTDYHIVDCGQGISDMHDTAAILSQLDLLISVDSGPVHLAGALGIPCWVLISCNPDWRWLEQRKDTIWYPSVQLFRQSQLGVWNDTIAELTQALKQKVDPQSEPQPTSLLPSPQLSSPEPASTSQTTVPRISSLQSARPQLIQSNQNNSIALAYTEARQKFSENDFKEAANIYNRILKQDPHQPNAYIGLAYCLLQLNMKDQTLDIVRHGLKLYPDHIAMLKNFYPTAFQYRQLDIAQDCLTKLYQMKAGSAEDIRIFANVLRYSEQFERAEELLLEAHEIEPDKTSIIIDLILIHLVSGYFETAWSLLIKYNDHWRKKAKKYQTELPLWKGENLKGKKIVLIPDQGHGDFLMFLKLVMLFKQKGTAKIYVITPQYMRELIRTVPGIDHLLDIMLDIDQQLQFSGGADYIISMMEGAAYLNLNPAMIPKFNSHFKAPQKWLEAWQKKTQEQPEKWPDNLLKVGLVWYGRPDGVRDQDRSLTFQHVQRLAEIPSIQLYTLQANAPKNHFHENGYKHVVELSHEIKSFMDTAAIMSMLDIVISVDTAGVHLAAGLGLKTWGLLNTNPDWRWLTNRTDSPWYPTLILYRQKTAGDWDEVLDRLIIDLSYEASVHKGIAE